jgi:hypothetical protein
MCWCSRAVFELEGRNLTAQAEVWLLTFGKFIGMFQLFASMHIDFKTH